MSHELLMKHMNDSTFWTALVGLRREVHMHPEPGFKETRTSRRVYEILTKFGGIPEAQIRKCAITGLVADIHGTAAAVPNAVVKCVALRSDLDALTMTELNQSLPYRSKNEGIAHMCGHDGHIAGLVGAAILLQRRADKIPSNMTVRLLFQPAEESTPPGTAGYDFAKTGGGGAMPMIMENCLEGVDEVYGWHNWPAWNLGDMHLKTGAVMAHSSEFVIEITGRGGHGSQPHACIDPIVCGAAVVSALQTIVSRNLHSSCNAVITVGQFHAGERNNVIPDKAIIQGTIRDVNDAAFDIIKRRMQESITGICKGYGCTSELKITEKYQCVRNEVKTTEVVRRCAARLGEPFALKVKEDNLPMMGGEDFSFFQKERLGCFFFLGTNEFLHSGLSTYEGSDDAPRSNCICHGTAYDFNDNVLPRVILMFLKIVEDRFGVDLYSQEEVIKGDFNLVNSGSGAEPDAKRQRCG